MLPWLETLLFAGTLYLSFLTFRALGRDPRDGWSYPAAEERWLKGGLVGFLILSRESSLGAVPALWSAGMHEMAALTCLVVATYSLNGILYRARFHDLLCVNRAPARPFARAPFHAAAFSLVFALGVLCTKLPQKVELAFGALSLALLFSLVQTLRATEWKRIRKRSSLNALHYFYSLLFVSLSMALLPLISYCAPGSFRSLAVALSATLLLGSYLRNRASARRQHRARALVEECRQELNPHAAASARLQALCSFVENEWGAVRVSLISVNGNMGLVIASDGADALPLEGRAEPRRIGPFLKRACREGHILYAPVAEELGHEFQEQGLKHSSLAIPFHQAGAIRAVLCLMAEEGERIDPSDALVLECFTRDLGLEILSATAQYVAEERAAKLLALAKQSDSIAVEHMDDWGYLHLPNAGEVRFLVAAQVLPSPTVARHPSRLLNGVHAAYARELRALWRSLAQAFEFVPREQQGVLWIVSPRDFQNPFLNALGPERSALLLCHTLGKLSRQLADKDSYLLLGGNQPRIAAGQADVKADLTAPGGIDLDHAYRENLHQLLLAGEAGAPRWLGRDPREAAARGFAARAAGGERLAGQDFFSLLSVAADKKELRRLEQKAAEAAREFLKKAA
jgi:hypothetical protein